MGKKQFFDVFSPGPGGCSRLVCGQKMLKGHIKKAGNHFSESIFFDTYKNDYSIISGNA